MTPEEFEKLDQGEKDRAIDKHDETERTWWVRCPKCGFRMTGTLQELRGKPCGACGHGGGNG